jgi:hypothetical protein
MNVTIKFHASERLEKFIKWITSRAKSELHKDHANLIQEFKDKVLMAELKRLKENDQVISDIVELPDSVLTKPKKKKTSSIRKSSSKVSGPILTETRPDISRSGNGHKSLKIRDLFDEEKDIIRMKFMDLNGQIKEDACLEIQKRLGTEVAIFQVTGFVTYLHLQIAEGKFEVHDMMNYLMFLQSHRNRWATYNSPKYRNKRIQSQAA